MVLQHGFVVIPQRFRMLHGNQEVVVNTRMTNVEKHGSQEASHDIQVAKVGHQLAVLGEVMEVPCHLNDPHHIMVTVVVICRLTNRA